jgi:hypothetical protein
MPEASGDVVIDHAHRLHEGVTDGRANKLESAPQQILAKGFRLGGLRGYFSGGFPRIANWAPADEAPEVGVEAAEFLLHCPKGAGVPDGGGDLEAVAHNAGVGEQPPDLSWTVSGHHLRIEAVKSPPVVVAFVQDGGPTQAGLGALKDEELEERAVIVSGHAPFMVMVLDVQGGFGPTAAREARRRVS